jgi:hypothetical protein
LREYGPEEYARDFLILEIGIVVVAVTFAIMGASESSTVNDAVNSRLATVYSLTNFGTWRIDRPLDKEPIPFEQGTIDKVMVGGRLISSKPPVLPLLMTAEYLFLNKTLGWDLDDDHQRDRSVRIMSVSLIGGSYIVAIIFFLKTLRLFVVDPMSRAVLLFSLAFCTQLWGYATHINNHVPAAAMIVVALYFALGVGTGKLTPARWRFAAFGFFGGLVPTLDLPGTVFVALAGLYLLGKFPRKTLVWCTLAAAIPIGVHCASMLAATGSILPVQTREEVYLYEGSYWRNPQGIDALNEPKGTYLFHMLLGRSGLFSLYPVLLVGVAATLGALLRKEFAYRGHVLVGALGFLILTAYYLLKTNNYGGEAYGFRWYIVAMPVLLLMGAPILANLRARWKWFFVCVMIGISFYSAFECAKSPWGANNTWTSRIFLGPSYGPR